jgi:hypothetical protein
MNSVPEQSPAVNPRISVEVEPSLRPASAQQLASFSATLQTDLGTVLVRDGRILKSKSGSVWAAMPNFSLPTQGRQWSYHSTIELSPALAAEVTTQAVRAYESWRTSEK